MTDTPPQDTHQRAAEPPALAPVFTPPAFAEPAYTDDRDYTPATAGTMAQHEAQRQMRQLTGQERPQDAPAAPPAPQEPREGVTAATAPAQGPVPVLSGSFALYVTPENAIVLAYRPEGASVDKQLLVPPFITEMVARQTGHSVHDVLNALGEAL